MHQVFLFIFILSLTLPSFAQVKVAFLEIFHPTTGEVVPLEPGGRFGHVAISFNGGWLHSFPGRPVERVKSLEAYGRVVEVVTIEGVQALSHLEVGSHLGKSFDTSYSWGPTNTTYCSKLVGQILSIPPQPTSFSADVWQSAGALGDGWGLSPDDIYIYLMNGRTPHLSGRAPHSNCEIILH